VWIELQSLHRIAGMASGLLWSISQAIFVLYRCEGAADQHDETCVEK
jgi:hypothetical protein